MNKGHHLRDLYSDPDDLRLRIANYRQTRRTAAPSMHRWLDALIADAVQRLHELTHADGDGNANGDGAAAALAAPQLAPDSDVPDVPQARPDRALRARRTYPFDEGAPRQRPAL